jgi:ATP phosphoribosyltransferase
MMSPIILGLPKGSLQEATFAMMRKAGFTIVCGSRSYLPSCDDQDLKCRLLRPQEIPRYVELGLLDAGITGYDWIYENNADVVEVCELCYSKSTSRPVRWVIAVPNDSPIKSIQDLNGKRISTEAVGLTRRFLEANGIKAEIEFSWGATEVKAPELVDAIVDLTETGSSLRANNLRILETILTSTTRLISNKAAWQDSGKRAKMEQLAMLMSGALEAESRVLLKMNVPASRLAEIVEVLPSLHAPTVNALNANGWHAVESVVEEVKVREIVPALREAGATGIIELPLNKIIF